MPTYHELFHIMTDARPSFFHVTDHVEEFAARSGIRHGMAIVYS